MFGARVIHDNFKKMMATSIQELGRAGLRIDCFEIGDNSERRSSSEPPSMPNKPLSCPVTVLCNDINKAVRKLQFSVSRGEVYKKVAESQFTFKFLCDMETFLHNLMGNDSFKDRLFNIFNVCCHCCATQRAISLVNLKWSET